MSGGLTPCRQLRPSSRREHVSASNSKTQGPRIFYHWYQCAVEKLFLRIWSILKINLQLLVWKKNNLDTIMLSWGWPWRQPRWRRGARWLDRWGWGTASLCVPASPRLESHLSNRNNHTLSWVEYCVGGGQSSHNAPPPTSKRSTRSCSKIEYFTHGIHQAWLVNSYGLTSIPAVQLWSNKHTCSAVMVLQTYLPAVQLQSNVHTCSVASV